MARAVRFDFIGRDVSASKTAGRVGSSFGHLGGRLRGFGIGVGAALGLGGAALIKFGVDSITMAANFDKTMRQVAQITDTPASGLKNLKKLALDMGASTSFSARQAGDAMLELAKGGMSIAEIRAGGLQQTLILAAAGGLELGESAKTMTNALKAFRIPAKKAGIAAAAIAGGANASTASVEDLAMALAQVGPGARNAGLNLNDTVGVLAAFHNWGLKGSDAGTSLKTMLARLVPTTKAAKDAMADLGLKTTDAAGTMLPIPQIAQNIQTAFKGLSDAERIKAMATIFGSDATRAATILMNEGRAGIEKYIKATQDRGAAEALAKTNTSGAAGAFERLKGAIETVRLTIADGLLPAFADAADWLSSRLPGWLANLKGWWDKNKTAVDQLADSLSIFVSSSDEASSSGLTLKGTMSGLLKVAQLGALALLYLGEASQRVTQGFASFGIGIGHLVNAVDRLSGGTGHAGDQIIATWQEAKSKAQGQIDAIRTKVDLLRASMGSIPRNVTTTFNFRTVGRRPGAGAYAASRERVGATGGIVTRPTRALIGERGPEAVVPLNRAPGARPLPVGMGAGGAVTINVYGVTDPRAVALKVRDELVRHQGRNGTTGIR